ncbi:hypothetical protein PC120_g19600 [Phytophthora cactorum]|nr:hypothetical protein PC120_g19600 [Phytophthora cactorum]
MQLSLVMLMVMAGAIGHTSAASNGTLNHPINGWYRFQEYTVSDAGSSRGPGYASAAMVSDMVVLHTKLGGGGGSTCTRWTTAALDAVRCLTVAAQITTSSTWGRDSDPSEVAACAKDFQMKYGDLASFSTTSAAMDILPFFSKYSNGASSIVYGVSYGTVVVERLMHLNPPTVNGYALDGIATASGASGNKFEY